MQFRGTIKRISPEQAKKMFKFNLPPDAKGVTFQYRKNKTVIYSYSPEKNNNHLPKSQQFKSNYANFSKLNRITHRILKTIIHPVWTKIADREKYFSGYHLFVSINIKRIQKGLENILFTVGDLPAPQIRSIEITDSYIEFQLQNHNPEYELGIVIMDSETLNINQFPPAFYPDEPISIPIEGKPMLFLYYKQDKIYSPSVCIYQPLSHLGLVIPLQRGFPITQ